MEEEKVNDISTAPDRGKESKVMPFDEWFNQEREMFGGRGGDFKLPRRAKFESQTKHLAFDSDE